MARVKDDDLITCLTYLVDDKPKYIIKMTPLRDTYYLYEMVNGKLIKTKYKAEIPTDLYKYIKD